MINEILTSLGIYFFLKNTAPKAVVGAIVPVAGPIGFDVEGKNLTLYASERSALPISRDVEDPNLALLAARRAAMPIGVSIGKVIAGEPFSLNLGGIGISVLGDYFSQELESPVPSVMAGMIKEGISVAMEGAVTAIASIGAGTINPLGLMTIGMGSAQETGRVTSGGVKVAQSVLGVLPLVGTVLGGMLAGAYGEVPESPYVYYDPTTRRLVEGTQFGEPLNQFDSASRQWMDVKANIDALIIKRYAVRYGLSPDQLLQTREMPSEFGVPFGYSEGASDAAIAMVNDVYEKGGGILAFLNPVEKQIYENYNALFLKEQTTTGTGGPSEYMVYLASLGA